MANRDKETKGKKALEAIAAAIGAFLAVATLTIVLWDGINGSGGPPSLTVRALGTSEQPGGFLLEIEVVNGGGKTAAAVEVEGVLMAPGAEPETSTASFDYVPRHSQVRGGLLFTRDPGSGDVSLRALGYADP